MDPKYEIRIQIIDRETEEVIEQETTFINNEKRISGYTLGMPEYSEEAAETAFWDVIRHFRERSQVEHERLPEPEEEV